MATVIDALVMTLGLDTRDFDKGEKRSTEGMEKFRKRADATAKSVVEGGKKMGESFATVRNQIISLLAVVTAGRGLKNFITEGVTGMAELGRRAQNLGMTARELDSWGAAAESVGGSAEGMQKSLQALAGGIEEFKLTGQSSLLPVLRSIGVETTDGQGKIRKYGDILLDIADRFSKMSKQDAMFFGHKLGFDDHAIYLLEQGRTSVASLREEMEKNSGVNEKTVAEAMRVQAAWAGFNRQLKGLRDTLFGAIEPALRPLINMFAAWITKNRELIATKIVEWVKSFAKWIKSIDWEKVKSGISDFFNAVKTGVQWIKNADAATDGWTTKILLAVAALRLLGGAAILGGITRLTGALGSALAASRALLPTAAVATAGDYAGTGVGEWLRNKALGDDKGRVLQGKLHRALLGMFAALGNKKAAAEAKRIDSGEIPAYGVTDIFSDDPEDDAKAKAEAEKYLPRGLRNNNPGNLNFAGQRGASPEGGPNGRFAVFGSQAEGIAALIRQLQLYVERGNDTIQGIVNKYAPAADGNNVKAYIEALMQATGKSANERLDLNDKNTLFALVRGIVKQEGNGQLTAEQIMGGIRINAQQRLAGRGQALAKTSASTVETHIGTLQVNTAATDAQGIVRDIRKELERNALVAGANGGAN